MKPAFRVADVRQGFGYALNFFTVVIGYEDDNGTFHGLVQVKDCELRQAQSGERYFKYPQRPRITDNKDGTATYVLKEGKKVFDSTVSVVFEEVQGRWTPSKASKQAEQRITQLVLEQVDAQGSETAGRGTAAAKPAATRAPQSRQGVAANTGAAERGNPLGGDDLPF